MENVKIGLLESDIDRTILFTMVSACNNIPVLPEKNPIYSPAGFISPDTFYHNRRSSSEPKNKPENLHGAIDNTRTRHHPLSWIWEHRREIR